MAEWAGPVADGRPEVHAIRLQSHSGRLLRAGRVRGLVRGRGDAGQIVAICTRDRARQAIPIVDLSLPTPPLEGAEWIDAYRHWQG